MTVELVTGYSGADSSGEPNRHVSSADDGARQAGTVGTGMYVLGTGSQMSATMEDANTLVVADGDALINGRHVRIPDTLSFTIPTGVQAQKVSNLAVLRYSVGPNSVESVEPVVLTGEPSSGTPTDPAYNSGSILDGDSLVDMPLYRVVTDGINAQTPVKLFSTVPSIDALDGDITALGSRVTDAESDITALDSRIITGSKSFQWQWPGNNYCQLFDSSELVSMLGREFDADKDFCGVMNGAWDDSNTAVCGAIYSFNSKVMFAFVTPAPSANSWIRVNYIIVMGE